MGPVRLEVNTVGNTAGPRIIPYATTTTNTIDATARTLGIGLREDLGSKDMIFHCLAVVLFRGQT